MNIDLSNLNIALEKMTPNEHGSIVLDYSSVKMDPKQNKVIVDSDLYKHAEKLEYDRKVIDASIDGLIKTANYLLDRMPKIKGGDADLSRFGKISPRCILVEPVIYKDKTIRIELTIEGTISGEIGSKEDGDYKKGKFRIVVRPTDLEVSLKPNISIDVDTFKAAILEEPTVLWRGAPSDAWYCDIAYRIFDDLDKKDLDEYAKDSGWVHISQIMDNKKLGKMLVDNILNRL